jgi:myxalamid-type polyketide synthase MxaB
LAILQLSQQLADILGIKQVEKIDLDLGFSDLGLDSLASVELRNKIQSSYAIKLPATAIFNYPSIHVLANYLLRLIFQTNLASDTTEEEQNYWVKQVENITNEEAEALLLDELKDLDF